MKRVAIRPEYVEFIPKNLEEGVLYISKRFSTASHLCCCGCGSKIVTPLRETEYRLTESDGRVTIHPSIGNWDHQCRSHYLIRGNRVVWAGTMNRRAIERGRERDEALREAYFRQNAWPWWRRAVSRLKQLFSK